MAKYSIIIPTYNSIKYIKECVQSVLDQHVNDFQLIIVDSGSTDHTLQWIYGLQDSRITVYESPNRLGIEENWARIKEIEKAEFMTILGHDDVLHSDYLQTMGSLIDKHPDASLYQTHFLFKSWASCHEVHTQEETPWMSVSQGRMLLNIHQERDAITFFLKKIKI